MRVKLRLKRNHAEVKKAYRLNRRLDREGFDLKLAHSEGPDHATISCEFDEETEEYEYTQELPDQ